MADEIKNDKPNFAESNGAQKPGKNPKKRIALIAVIALAAIAVVAFAMTGSSSSKYFDGSAAEKHPIAEREDVVYTEKDFGSADLAEKNADEKSMVSDKMQKSEAVGATHITDDASSAIAEYRGQYGDEANKVIATLSSAAWNTMDGTEVAFSETAVTGAADGEYAIFDVTPLGDDNYTFNFLDSNGDAWFAELTHGTDAEGATVTTLSCGAFSQDPMVLKI